MNTSYEQHHLGRLLPPMPQADFERLSADLAANGLLEEIVLYEAKVLDGWSRYRACQVVQVEPRFRAFTGDNPVAYVLAKNVLRRHLNPVQILKVLEVARPALAAEAAARSRANLRQAPSPKADADREILPTRGPVAVQIAALAGVSDKTVKDYHAVQVHGSVELKEAVDREEVAISDAARVARQQPPEKQNEALKRFRSGAAPTLRQAAGPPAAGPSGQDRLGLPIPDCLTGAFQACVPFKKAKSCLSRAKGFVKQLMDGPGAALLPGGDWQTLLRRLAELRTQLDYVEPYTVCPDCLGRGCRPDANQGRPICRGGGFISRRQYQNLSEPAKQRLHQRTTAS